MSLTTLAASVRIILGMSSNPEVCRVYTGRVVALVHDYLSRRRPRPRRQIHRDVGRLPHFATPPESTVPLVLVGGQRPCPLPALGGTTAVNEGPEPVGGISVLEPTTCHRISMPPVPLVVGPTHTRGEVRPGAVVQSACRRERRLDRVPTVSPGVLVMRVAPTPRSDLTIAPVHGTLHPRNLTGRSH